jgi:hypothetical protein
MRYQTDSLRCLRRLVACMPSLTTLSDFRKPCNTLHTSQWHNRLRQHRHFLPSTGQCIWIVGSDSDEREESERRISFPQQLRELTNPQTQIHQLLRTFHANPITSLTQPVLPTSGVICTSWSF